MDKIERLQKNLDDLTLKKIQTDEKIKKLTEEIKKEQNKEIIAIVTAQYKTPKEIAAFIKLAKTSSIIDLLQEQEETHEI